MVSKQAVKQTHAAEATVRGAGPVAILREAGSIWLAGVVDAIMLVKCIFFFARSDKIRFRTLQCFMLNGVIFLGSILLFNYIFGPALGFLRQMIYTSPQEGEVWKADFVGSGSSFSVLYKVLWIGPMYVISFILNMVMYQEVADEALMLLDHKATRRTVPPQERFTNESFRALQTLVYLVQMNLLYYVPLVGPVVYFVHSCWLASIYSFEYRWVFLGMTSSQRLEYFEDHWLYFTGFGFPVSLVCLLSPRVFETGVFALLFPLCILTAVGAKPRQPRRGPFRRLPVFYLIQAASCLALKLFEGIFSSGSTSAAKSPPASIKGLQGCSGYGRSS